MAGKPKERMRLIILAFLSAVVCGLYLILAMNYQVVNGAKYYGQTQASTTSVLPLKAARGEIVDTNGTALAENETGLNIVFYYSFLPKSEQNEIIACLIEICEENGETWYDPLPITQSGEPEFLPDREKEVSTLKGKLELNVYATADDCMYYMREETFSIKGYDDNMTRKIAGVRYGMVLADFSVNNNQYVFAENVSADTVLKIKEMSHLLPGVDVAENDIRVYPDGDLIPHVVGYLGAIYAEDWNGSDGSEGYRDKGYKMSDLVGKAGIEKVMEDQLHGVDGERTVEQSKNGEILSETVTTPAQPGNKVVLTIDSEFQRRVQEELEEYIAYLKSLDDPEKGSDIKGAAISVLDVRTGAVLAMVTYPSYDVNDFYEDYTGLLSDELHPLTNRVTQGLYRPGSTFKTVVAAAGLEEGLITPSSTYNCTRVYRYYDIIPGNQFRPQCLGYHGNLNVSQALTVSCNIFFYDLGRRLGIDTINRYANLMGLGVETGLEIPTAVGGLSGPERSELLGGTWVQGNVVQASIGQMDTAVSPLQLSIQALTLANRGTRMKPYLIKEIRSYDDSEVLSVTEPEAVSSFEISDENYAAIVEGMKGAANNIRAEGYTLSDLPYEVALKTGSPQKSADVFHSAAIAFAPVNNPDIAIGIMLEESQNASWMVRKILDAYYETAGKNYAPSAQTTEK
ncbi:MAG: penicillin-binding transpeptidase domain-containing protein [Oscillospiraceae bacterium]|nr:penicillin-binding transpeptidase domain-containing protein [Oscillospiraceae bacterium]